MDHVRSYLTEKQAEIAGHPFFARLERRQSFTSTMDFAAGMTFWVFVFQDILRLNEGRVEDPALKRIARHHRAEDRGHEGWFLDDLAMLDGSQRDLRWLFGKHHAQTRDAAYSLVAEVFRANDDYVRIALLLTLESAGHVFFEKMAGFVEPHDSEHRLRYFSHSHLDVEKNHSLFEAELMKTLEVELPLSLRNECIAMIDRCYVAFHLLFAGLESRLVRRANGTLSVPPPGGAANPSTMRVKKAEGE